MFTRMIEKMQRCLSCVRREDIALGITLAVAVCILLAIVLPTHGDGRWMALW